MSGLEYLLGVLRERGLRVERSPDGDPVLAGSRSEVTDALRAMLSLYRDELLEIAEPAPPAAPPGPPTREWRWPLRPPFPHGYVFREADLTPDQRDPSHPSRATHWRYEGEKDWKRIERVEVVACGPTTSSPP